MKLINLLSYCAFALTGIITSCKPYDPDPDTPPQQIEGYAPVYADANDAAIRSEAPRDIDKGGKIYIKDNILYQVETGKGIHVINIAQPDAPQKLRFLHIIGCQEVSIIGNNLYTNNLNDLIVINIQDINNINEVDRITNTFHLVDVNRPPTTGWFECIDPSKGTVVGWEMKTLYSPKCLY